MNILSALDDRNLLGASIRDPDSWKPWRALLAAAFGLPLDPYQAELFCQCTGRAEAPTAPASYLWLVIGRRGGKSFTMALIAVFLAVFKDWRNYLSPGERAIVLLVAADREQARILHRYCQGILRPPILQSSVWNVTAGEIELKGGVTIEVVTRSYRTVRGRSVCVAVLDELAFWRDDDSANPDSEVLNAVRASMATFGSDAMVIAGSSPYARRGVLWDAFRRWFGKDDARNLVWRAATRTMNPTVPQEFIDAEYERDAASANAEYGAAFRSDVAEFVSMDVLDACMANGVFEIPPISGASYVAFVDPSGGSSDSMTLAIAHRDKFGISILDCIREIRPPFSPESVVDEFCETLKQYHITKVTGDRYAGEWAREPFRKRGIAYEPSEKPKSDIYRDTLPLLNSRKCQLLDPAAANRYWARCIGQDAAPVDDETVGRIKEFLSDKLSDEDHAKVCSMLSGDVDAQDTEPDDVELPKNAIGRAADARTVADFNKQFPDLGKINIDSFGLHPRKRPASGDMASFNAMFPDAAKIKVL